MSPSWLLVYVMCEIMQIDLKHLSQKKVTFIALALSLCMLILSVLTERFFLILLTIGILLALPVFFWILKLRDVSFSESFLEWEESRNYYRLRQHLMKKGFLCRIGHGRIGGFLFLSTLLFRRWMLDGAIAGLKLGLIPALLLSVLVSALMGAFVSFFVSWFPMQGKYKISLFDTHVTVLMPNNRLKQWTWDQIDKVAFVQGNDNGEPYTAIKVHGEEGIRDILFIANPFHVYKLKEFFAEHDITVV